MSLNPERAAGAAGTPDAAAAWDRPPALTAAAWLSYVPVGILVLGGGASPLGAIVLAVPWIVTAHGLFRGEAWAWWAGLALAGLHLALVTILPFLRPVIPPGVYPALEIQAVLLICGLSLLFLAAYVPCLLAASTRQYVAARRSL